MITPSTFRLIDRRAQAMSDLARVRDTTGPAAASDARAVDILTNDAPDDGRDR
jgi:hypothetical protein